jgi:AcrR family transcriptional regulator
MTAGLRERKKLATREALRSAALRLAVERGLDRLTVEEIAEAADVSPRTFFNYFASKEAALVDIDPELESLLVEALLARPADEDPLTAARRVMVDKLGEYEDRRVEWSARAELIKRYPSLQARHLASHAHIEKAVCTGVALRAGLDPDRDLYPALVAAIVVAALRTSVMHWRTNQCAGSLHDLVDGAFGVLASGLVKPS